MTDDGLPIRAGAAEDWDTIYELLLTAFHEPADEELRDIERDLFEPTRSLVVTDEHDIVGHAAAYTRELTVPGAILPAAHVTLVGVAPTHRRRGLLTRLMRRQLRELRDAGREPLAVLWASEGRIYPRFGYGLAAHRLQLAVDTREVRLPAGTAGGRLRLGDPARLQPELARVYERLRADRPGWSSRDPRWWRYVLADPPSRRRDATRLRAVLHEGPDGLDGYALFRTKGGWEHTGPRGEVIITGLAATTPEAYAALWRFLLGIDLVTTASYSFAAVDEPLQHLVTEPQRLGARLADSLWVRLIDVGAALAGRRYTAPVDVVVEVTDPLLPENAGRWRLVGDRDGARCTRTDDPADLACDVRDLGAAYLGGSSLVTLAGAGRVRELRPDTLARTAVAFGWDRAPAAAEVF